MIYVFIGLPMLLEILMVIVYSIVIYDRLEMGSILSPKVHSTIITRSPKEKDYGNYVEDRTSLFR